MIHRGGQILELGEPAARLLVELARASGIDRDHALEDADDLARTLGLIVVRAQQIEGGLANLLVRVRGLDDPLEELRALLVVVGLGEQRLGRREGALGIAQAVEPHRRDARPVALAVLLRLTLEPALPELDQIRPALVALEQTLEALADLGIVGRQRQELLVVADRLVGLIGDILRELRSFAQQADAARTILGRFDRAVVETERIGPAFGDRIDDAEALQRRVRRRSESRDAHENLLEHGRIVTEPFVAEPARALTDHLGDLRLDGRSERFIIERDDLVGLIEVGREGLDLFPGAHRVR